MKRSCNSFLADMQPARCCLQDSRRHLGMKQGPLIQTSRTSQKDTGWQQRCWYSTIQLDMQTSCCFQQDKTIPERMQRGWSRQPRRTIQPGMAGTHRSSYKTILLGRGQRLCCLQDKTNQHRTQPWRSDWHTHTLQGMPWLQWTQTGKAVQPCTRLQWTDWCRMNLVGRGPVPWMKQDSNYPASMQHTRWATL